MNFFFCSEKGQQSAHARHRFRSEAASATPTKPAAPRKPIRGNELTALATLFKPPPDLNSKVGAVADLPSPIPARQTPLCCSGLKLPSGALCFWANFRVAKTPANGGPISQVKTGGPTLGIQLHTQDREEGARRGLGALASAAGGQN